MTTQQVPRRLRKAIEWVEADPARAWTVREIAAACGVPPRTLQRQFRRYMGQMLMAFVRDLRLNHARVEILRACGTESVTEIAVRCGFTHLGRFAASYRARYGESPSATLRRHQNSSTGGDTRPAPLSLGIERPGIAVLPFDLAAPDARHATDLADDIIAALMRTRWIAVSIPANARYHLRGKVWGDGSGRVRVTALLIDVQAGRYLWADHWNGDADDLLAFGERVASRIATAIQPALRDVEIDRACHVNARPLSAWELTLRALRHAMSVEPASEAIALELLEQAMELSPRDPLPLALAAWCHGLHGGHNFSPVPDHEKSMACTLAERAARLSNGDPLTETFIAAGYTLAHDLERASIHVDRALALDGGSSWAWGRRGLINTYSGEHAEAIECLQIARALAPGDRLNFLWAVGIAAGHFEAARYEELILWFERAISENPGAVWINHVLAPACERAGRKDSARRSLTAFTNAFPNVTIEQIKSGLPYRASFLDRIAEGLESIGMPPC